MNCPYCNSKIPDAIICCPECGRKIVETDAPMASAPIKSNGICHPLPIAQVYFDYEKYVQQSQDFLFKEAVKQYNAFNFNEALNSFLAAHDDGNIFAAAHLGTMYFWGEGCNKDYGAAVEWFARGYQYGCPLAAAWYSECYRFGYGVEKNEDYAEKLYKATETALREMCNVEDTAALYFLGFNLVMSTDSKPEGIRLLETAEFRGDAGSSIQLAECYLNGWGVSKNAHQAVYLLTQHPAPNSKKYHYLLGRCYYHGEGVGQDYIKAFEHFEKSAHLGYGKAKDHLADCYRTGQGVEKNIQEAVKWYTDAVDNDKMATAAFRLGFMYRFGEGVPKDAKKAIEYYLIAAEGGLTYPQRIVAQEYIYGGTIEKNYAAAQMWLEKAATKGDAEAQLILGRFYASDFGYKDYQKAFKWIKKSAEQGVAEAEHTMGDCYREGFCVNKDVVIANHWYEKAAKQEYPKAMYECGVSYINGRGVFRNIHEGINYLKAAADKDVPEACETLAKLFKSGFEGSDEQISVINLSDAQIYATKLVEIVNNGEAQCLLASILQEMGNATEAKEWYQKAVDNGNKSAKLALSKMYIYEGVNYSKAIEWLETIASSKNGEAQFFLAYCLENGFGCPKDKKRAKALYNLAKANGYFENPFLRKKKFGLF